MLKRFREQDLLGKPLSEKQKREIAGAQSARDEDIDTSDIPETWQFPAGAVRGRDFQPFPGASVSWNCRHVFQLFSVIERPELPARHLRDVCEFAAAVTSEKLLGLFAVEGPNHRAGISRMSLNEER
jgi:hypothetical protein